MTALVPDFIIGGAPRAGTTYLAHTLDTHPGVAMAKPWRPEPKVFLRAEPAPEAYRDAYARYWTEADAGRIRGEKTTNYFESAEAPGRVALALPGVRMVFLVREPVARAYSNWLWSRMNGLEDLPFERAIELEGARVDPLPPEQSHARPHDYLTRADYAGFARRWIESLGRERVGFFLYEDLIGAVGAAALRSIQEFIGVDPLDLPDRPREAVNEARHTHDPLDPELGELLRERVRPLVEDFAAVSGLDVGAWGYSR
jgi:hypothetical protein